MKVNEGYRGCVLYLCAQGCSIFYDRLKIVQKMIERTGKNELMDSN